MHVNKFISKYILFLFCLHYICMAVLCKKKRTDSEGYRKISCYCYGFAIALFRRYDLVFLRDGKWRWRWTIALDTPYGIRVTFPQITLHILMLKPIKPWHSNGELYSFIAEISNNNVNLMSTVKRFRTFQIKFYEEQNIWTKMKLFLSEFQFHVVCVWISILAISYKIDHIKKRYHLPSTNLMFLLWFFFLLFFFVTVAFCLLHSTQ